MCRLMIDTNILLDCIDSRRPDSQAAREVFDRCCGWGEFGMASALSFKDVYYVMCKARDEAWARLAVEKLMGLLAIAPVDAEICEEALRSNEPDFEDGIIRACAELNDADFIITRDKDAFANSKIRSVTAREYLSIAGSYGH